MVSIASCVGIRRIVSRLSERFASAVRSAVSPAIVTFFAFGIAPGLVAWAVVAFCFFSTALGLLADAAVSLRQFLVGPSYARRFVVALCYAGASYGDRPL